MNELIEGLKDSKVGWAFLSKEEQECMKRANTKGAVLNLLFSGKWESAGKNGWELDRTGANEIFRIKPDYQPEPAYKNKVFASTCDESKDSANNVVGVTAHCKCGNVFCYNVVHGKERPKPSQPEPEFVDLEIVVNGQWLGIVSECFLLSSQNSTNCRACRTSRVFGTKMEKECLMEHLV